MGEYLKKGSKVYIEGYLQTRQYEKEGPEALRDEIKVKEMQMLDSRGGHVSDPVPRSQPEPAGNDLEDNIPF